MKNKIELIYNKMCYDCQFKFRNVIEYVKDNPEKNLNDLDLFKCKVDKTRDVLDDKNILPLALIFCRQDSYVFIWKDSIYNGDGTTKIPVINNTILLSQQTIHKIKGYNLISNSLTTTKKQQTLIPKIIEKNNHALKQSFNRQIMVINRQHFLHMSKMRKTIMLLSLVFILMFGAMGGLLGWYFLSGQNNSGSIIPPNKQRIDLSEHFDNSQLGVIADNRAETILTVAKDKNPDLKIDNLLVKNITRENAIIYVKSSSNIYKNDSTIIVSFLPQKISLLTHVTKRNFFINTNSPTLKQLLKIIELGNPNLKLEYVNIEDIITVENNQIILKGNLVSKRESKSIYVFGDSLELYFSNTGRKMLSNDLTEINLGDIKNYKSSTILEAVKLKNSNVLTEQIEVLPGAVLDKEANIKVKSDSKDYYIDSYFIKVEFRSFNDKIGTIKEKLEQNFREIPSIKTAFELDSKLILLSGAVTSEKGVLWGTHLFSFDGKYIDRIYQYEWTKIIRTPDNDKLLALRFNTSSLTYSRYLIDSSTGKILKEVKDNPNSPGASPIDIIFLQNGNILGLNQANDGTKTSTLFQLNPDGTFQKILQIIDNAFFDNLWQLKNGAIFLVSNSGKEIATLNSDYSVQKRLCFDYGNGKDFSFYEFENLGIILADKHNNIYHLYSDLSFKEKGKGNFGDITVRLRLKNGKFVGFSTEGMYTLNID
ncbi:hypothetical protein [Spiroplasma chrysopicola]|uniref:Uncharacterized protein n=1 Tax=Spiroplasma chrysopicola DF-1 TaxID=1276227 RepID=R4U418_9MOLU|nr:hypothetical protein [Spiroplasma chrysopicola]AGM25293.1 hypothetical protein SCHRY_v1c07170 [Spiroplasma chrysopicola DF-1]